MSVSLPSWFLIARKDFFDAYRDRTLYYMGGLYVAFGLGLGRIYGRSAEAGALLSESYVALLAFLLPITALAAAYDVVPWDRRSGRLRLLLTLPFSRRDVIVGTALCRSALLSTFALGFLGLLTVTAAAHGLVPPLADLAVVAVASVLYASCTACLVVAASGWTGSGPIALTTGILGLLTLLAWASVLRTVWRTAVDPATPGWIAAVQDLNLISGYLGTAQLLHGGEPTGVLVLLGGIALPLVIGIAAMNRTAI